MDPMTTIKLVSPSSETEPPATTQSRGHDVLARETERELARRFREGDVRAGEQLVTSCLPFVTSIAMEYRRWGAPIEDIVQEGSIGLLRAAERFDPERDVRLVTYAAYWIRAHIREFVMRSYRLVRLGTTKGERRLIRAYRTSSITEPSELARLTGLPQGRVEQLMVVLSRREASLDEQPASGTGTSVVSKLRARGPSPEQAAVARDQGVRSKAAIARALADLPEREQYIVRQRMMREEPETLQAIGMHLGVSKERVRQLEERARGKLRESLAEWAELDEAV